MDLRAGHHSSSLKRQTSDGASSRSHQPDGFEIVVPGIVAGN